MLNPPGSGAARTANRGPNRRKTQESPDDQLRKLQRTGSNKNCADCSTKLPQCVNLTVGCFVCLACSGIHRELNMRVKGIGASTFTQEEVDRLKQTSNDAVNQVYLARYNPSLERLRKPENNFDQQILRPWIQRKYRDKAWYSAEPQPTRVEIPPKPEPSQAKQPARDLLGFSSGPPAATPANNNQWDAFGGSSQQPQGQNNAFPADFGSTQTQQPLQQQQNFANFGGKPQQQPPTQQQQLPNYGGQQAQPPQQDFANFGGQQQPPQEQQNFANFGQQPPQQQNFANFGQQPPQQQNFANFGQQHPQQQSFANFGQQPPQQQQQQEFANIGQQPPQRHQQPPQPQGFANFGQQQPQQQHQFASFQGQGTPQQQQQGFANLNGLQPAPQPHQHTSFVQQPPQHQQQQGGPGHFSQSSPQQPISTNQPQLQSPDSFQQQQQAPQPISQPVPAPVPVQQPPAPSPSPSAPGVMGGAPVASAFDAFNTLSVTPNRRKEEPFSASAPAATKEPEKGKYTAGALAVYTDSSGNKSAIKVLKVHLDDELVPFYTIQLPDGREKQTDDGHLSEPVEREEIKEINSVLVTMDSDQLKKVLEFINILKNGTSMAFTSLASAMAPGPFSMTPSSAPSPALTPTPSYTPTLPSQQSAPAPALPSVPPPGPPPAPPQPSTPSPMPPPTSVQPPSGLNNLPPTPQMPAPTGVTGMQAADSSMIPSPTPVGNQMQVDSARGLPSPSVYQYQGMQPQLGFQHPQGMQPQQSMHAPQQGMQSNQGVQPQQQANMYQQGMSPQQQMPYQQQPSQGQGAPPSPKGNPFDMY